MENDLKIIPMFKFRVLLEWMPEYKVFVAQCLETGSVVTADDIDTAQSMIVELLEDEVSFNVQHGNLRNLTSSPSSILVWKSWMDAVKTGSQIIKKHFTHDRTMVGTINTQVSLVIKITHTPAPESHKESNNE